MWVETGELQGAAEQWVGQQWVCPWEVKLLAQSKKLKATNGMDGARNT